MPAFASAQIAETKGMEAVKEKQANGWETRKNNPWTWEDRGREDRESGLLKRETRGKGMWVETAGSEPGIAQKGQKDGAGPGRDQSFLFLPPSGELGFSVSSLPGCPDPDLPPPPPVEGKGHQRLPVGLQTRPVSRSVRRHWSMQPASVRQSGEGCQCALVAFPARLHP